MIIAWASTKNNLKFLRRRRSLRTNLFVPKMTFKHLPLTQRNQDTRRQTFCLAVDPGRCEFWRVQKNAAWGHCHLHNPPDIFPCNLIKLFTSLALNYLNYAKHRPSITSLCVLIVPKQPMSLFPSEWPTDAANKEQQRLTHKDFKQIISSPTCPLCLAFPIALGFHQLLKKRGHGEKENVIAAKTQSDDNRTKCSNKACKGSCSL